MKPSNENTVHKADISESAYDAKRVSEYSTSPKVEGIICIPVGDKSRWAEPPQPIAIAFLRAHTSSRRMNPHGSVRYRPAGTRALHPQNR